MRINTQFLVSVLVMALCKLEMVRSQKCEKAPNRNSENYLRCTNIVGKFPEVEYQLLNLVCENCSVPVIEQDIMKFFGGLILNMSNSHVQTIRKGAFTTFRRPMRKFVFDHNEITNLEQDLFLNFTSPLQIDFGYNNLSTLAPRQFGNTRIASLNLTNNRISDIRNCFASMTATQIDLSGNRIEEVPSGAFKDTKFENINHYFMDTFTTALILSWNALKTVYPGSFQTDGHFRTLDLSHNLLEIINNNTFSNTSIWKLDLSYNVIGVLERGAFKGLPNLYILNLSHNRITSLPMALFSRLHGMGVLDIANNNLKKIETMAFSGLLNLITLNVSHNSLESLSGATLTPLGTLKRLDVSYNRLRTLDIKSIVGHREFHQLSVNHNFWQCSDLATMYKLMVRTTYMMDSLADDYHVPNLHGIPCSKRPISVSANLTFDQFMATISEDKVLDDLYNVQLNTEKNENEQTSLMYSIYYMMLICTILLVASYLIAALKRICLFLQKRNAVPKSFSVLYNPVSDNDV